MKQTGYSAFLGLTLVVFGCAPHDPRLAADAVLVRENTPSADESVSPFGAYLAGRVAQEEGNAAAALSFFQEALSRSPEDPELMSRVMALGLGEGRLDIARPLARKILAIDQAAGLPNLLEAVDEMRLNHPGKALAHAHRLPTQGFYQLVGALVRAWADVGARMPAAAAVAELNGLQGFKPLESLRSLHAAMIEDLAGDRTRAEHDYAEALNAGRPPLRLVQLAGNFYERSGERQRAAKLYGEFEASGGAEAGVSLGLDPHGPPAPIVPNAQAGLAEALFDLASLLGEAESPEVAALNVRLALDLKPDFPLASLVLAGSYEAEAQLQAALAVYDAIDPRSPFAWVARLRKAALMDRIGDSAGAEEALKTMAAERPTAAEPLLELGNILRGHDQYRPAADAYAEAMKRLGSAPPARLWPVLYSRGMALERAGDWAAAEADLRQALALAPDQPDVLNYLGYSLIDRKQDMPEALKLIKRAVELKPQDGYIVDSLGWAYFRLGDYPEAENALEQAVELRPGDAEINDHLGDAYWQGGRHEEARLQWERALSLQPQPDLAREIQGKLEHPPAKRLTSASRHAD